MPTETETQECIDCGEEKAQEEFRKTPHTTSGYTSTCIQCLVEKRKGKGTNPGPTTYINPDAKKKTTREERHRIAGVAPLTEEESRAVDQATRNMLSHETNRRGERQPEPMAPIDELLESGVIDEPRRWYLCDRAVQGWRKGQEKRKAG